MSLLAIFVLFFLPISFAIPASLVSGVIIWPEDGVGGVERDDKDGSFYWVYIFLMVLTWFFVLAKMIVMFRQNPTSRAIIPPSMSSFDAVALIAFGGLIIFFGIKLLLWLHRKPPALRPWGTITRSERNKQKRLRKRERT